MNFWFAFKLSKSSFSKFIFSFDVIDTYFVFLRSAVLTGQLTLEEEQQRVLGAKDWLEERVKTVPAFKKYLSKWGDWENPW